MMGARSLAIVIPVMAILAALYSLGRALLDPRSLNRGPAAEETTSFVGADARRWQPPSEIPPTGPVALLRLRREYVPGRLLSMPSGTICLRIPRAAGQHLAFRACDPGQTPPALPSQYFRMETLKPASGRLRLEEVETGDVHVEAIPEGDPARNTLVVEVWRW